MDPSHLGVVGRLLEGRSRARLCLGVGFFCKLVCFPRGGRPHDHTHVHVYAFLSDLRPRPTAAGKCKLSAARAVLASVCDVSFGVASLRFRCLLFLRRFASFESLCLAAFQFGFVLSLSYIFPGSSDCLMCLLVLT